MRRREPEIKARTRPAGKAKERVTEEKGEHEGKGAGVGRKGMQQVENLVMDEIQENHRKDVKKLVEMMQKGEEEQEEQRDRVAPNMGAGGSYPQAMSVPEGKETQGMRWADCEDVGGKEEEERRAQEAREEERRAQEAREEQRRSEREVSAQEEQAEQEREVEAQGGARERSESPGGARGRGEGPGGATRKCEFSARGVPRVEQTHDMVAQRMVDPC